MEFGVGSRVRVQLSDGSNAFGVIEEPPCHSNSWFKIRLEDGTTMKQRPSAMEIVSNGPSTSPALSARRKGSEVDPPAIQSPTPKRDKKPDVAEPPVTPSAAEGGTVAQPPVSVATGAGLLLANLPEAAWAGRRVRIDSGKHAGQLGSVLSHKTGWIRVAVDSETEIIRRRANELVALDYTQVDAAKPVDSVIGSPSHARPGLNGSSASPVATRKGRVDIDSDDDAASEGDDDTTQAERALIGEAVKVVSGEHSGKVGFVTQRQPDGTFSVKLTEAEVVLKREQFRKTSSAAALAAALGSMIEPGSPSGLPGAMPRRTRTQASSSAASAPVAAPDVPPARRRQRPAGSEPVRRPKKPRVEEVPAPQPESVVEEVPPAAEPEDSSSSSSGSGTDNDGKELEKKSSRRSRANADKVVAQQMKELMEAGDIPTALDSLGLSEADKEALYEGLTPRRSTRAVRLLPAPPKSPARGGKQAGGSSAEQSEDDEAIESSEQEAPAPKPKPRRKPVEVKEEAQPLEPAEELVDPALPIALARKRRSSTVLPATMQDTADNALSADLDELEPAVTRKKKSRSRRAREMDAVGAQPFASGHDTTHDALADHEEMVSGNKRTRADVDVDAENLPEFDADGMLRVKRSRKIKPYKGVKFTGIDDEQERALPPTTQEHSMMKKRKPGAPTDRPLKGVGWEYVAVSEPVSGQPNPGFSASVSGSFYTLPLGERVAAYVHRMRDKANTEKRTSLLGFRDRMDLPVAGDPFFHQYRDWARPDKDRSEPSSSPLSSESSFQSPRSAALAELSAANAKASAAAGLSIAASIIGAGKEAKEAKEADTAGKVVRYFKLGANRLQKAVDISLGIPEPDSSSDESSDEEYLTSFLRGGEMSHLAEVSKAAVNAGKKYVPPPSVELNNIPYMYSWNYKTDLSLDKVSARGSHRRPPFYGGRGISTYIAAHEDALLYPASADGSLLPGLKNVDSFIFAQTQPHPLPGGASNSLVVGVEPAQVVRGAYLTKPAADHNSLYAYARCPACGIPKEDTQSSCWNVACLCSPLNARFSKTRHEEPVVVSIPGPADGLLNPQVVLPVKTIAATDHSSIARASYAAAGYPVPPVVVRQPSETTVSLPAGSKSFRYPEATFFKAPDAAAAIASTIVAVSQSAKLTATDVERGFAANKAARAVSDVYYDLVFDSASRRVLGQRPLNARVNADRKRLPLKSIWGHDMDEIECEHDSAVIAEDKDSPTTVSRMLPRKSTSDTCSEEEQPMVRPHVPFSVGRPWHAKWVKSLIAAHDQEEVDAIGAAAKDAHLARLAKSRKGNNKRSKKVKKTKKRDPSKQKIVIMDGWTYTIDEDDDGGAAGATEVSGDQDSEPQGTTRPHKADEDFRTSAIHRDPDFEGHAYKEIEREKSQDPYFADCDPYLSPYLRRPPDIYPFDPLAHEHVYAMVEARQPAEKADDDLLPECEASRELQDAASFRLAAYVEAQLLSDFQFDAPVTILGAKSHPRLLSCGDPGNELSLRYSLGQAPDDYQATKAAQVFHANLSAKDLPPRLGYPVVGSTNPGLGGSRPFVSDPLMFRVSSWRRGDEEEHPDLQSSAVLMDMAFSQLPLEEHRALSRETHERVAEVHRTHMEKVVDTLPAASTAEEFPAENAGPADTGEDVEGAGEDVEGAAAMTVAMILQHSDVLDAEGDIQLEADARSEGAQAMAAFAEVAASGLNRDDADTKPVLLLQAAQETFPLQQDNGVSETAPAAEQESSATDAIESVDAALVMSLRAETQPENQPAGAGVS